MVDAPTSPAMTGSLRAGDMSFAADGRFELFKTTKKYDGDVGREQHHYPTAEQLPA